MTPEERHMNSRMVFRILGGATFLGAACYAQSAPREMRGTFQNLDFAEGRPGAAPPGWFLGPPHTPVYVAETASGASCNAGEQCGTVRSIREDAANGLSFLYQVVDATRYRGSWLTFRAAVRADVALGSAARLLVRVHKTDGGTSFRDDMGGHPITSATWAFYEINAPIGMDARDIEFGMQLVGHGAAWIDNISMLFGEVSTSREEQTVRSLIRRFADSRNARDGQGAAATYSEDGEYIFAAPVRTIRGRTALAALWGGLPGQVSRTINNVEFLTPNIAVVRVDAEAGPKLAETFLVVKDEGEWRIRVHQAVLPSVARK
jgi:ketosteroid isomerase-like protein